MMGMQKERRFKSRGSKWGEPKVHRYLYGSLNKVWYVACRGPYKDIQGEVVDNDVEVTCKSCDPSLRNYATRG